MKRKIFTLLFIIVAVTAAKGQVAFEMGLNMANLSIKENDRATNKSVKVPTGFKPGFAGGFAADIALGEHAYFQPGAFFEMMGCKLKTTPPGKYNINAITFPLNFEYKSGEKCGNRFFFGGGPYLSDNIGGSYEQDALGQLPAVSTTLKIGSASPSTLKALDFGIGLNLGYQLKKRLYGRLHYQVGLANLVPGADGNNSLKSSAFGVTIGFLFGKCDNFKHIPGFGNRSGTHWRGMSKSRYSRKIRHPRN